MAPLSLLCLSVFLLTPLSLAQDPVHIPLVRRSSVGARSFDYVSEAERLRDRYGYTRLSNETTKRATAAIPIINQNSDSSYLGLISVGTPRQNFSVVLDTGSADLWLADTACTSCTRSTKLFDTSASSTFRASTSADSSVVITYGSGKAAGTVAQDTVSMGGFTLSNQTILAVNQLTSGLIDGAVSGILGLGWSDLSSTRSVPFWENLAQAGQLTSTDMSFYLTRQINSARATSQTFGGWFTLGGTNSSLYTGDIEFLTLPVQTPTYWLLGMSGVTVNGKSVTVKTGTSALSAIDTGTTLIGGPTDDVATIWAAVPGSAASSSNGFYTFPCSTQVSISMAFGGKSWSISTADMNLGPERTGSSRCVGSIFDLSMGSSIPAGGDNPSWVVGDSFLKNVYTVFRASPPSVGFARLSASAGSSASGSYPLAGTNSQSTVYPTSSSTTGTTGGSLSGTTSVASSLTSTSLIVILLSALASSGLLMM